MAELDDSLATLGPRLRALRRELSMTLAAVASGTGISVSTLSRLESGERRATLELLLPLARTYAVTLDSLIDGPTTGDPRVTLRPIRRHGMTMVPLTERPGGIRAYKIVLPSDPGERVQNTHEGYEWFYVLDGHLTVLLGDHEFTMKPGEAAEFDTRVPHWFGAANGAPAEILSLFGEQGERAHVRARSVPQHP